MSDNIVNTSGGILGNIVKVFANAASQASERRTNMNKLEKAIADIHSPSFKVVLSGLYDADSHSGGDRVFTSSRGDHSHGFLSQTSGNHFHSLCVEKEDVPTHAWISSFVSEIKTVCGIIAEELKDQHATILRLIDTISGSSELVQAFNRTHDALAAEMVAEQSSHRRFEQLVQSLQASQSEVRAIYDAIDVAIKKATEVASSGVLKQIEDKGKSVALEMQAEIRSCTKEELAPIIARFQDEMARFASEKTELAQGEFGKLKEQIAQALAEIAAASKADLDKQSSAIAAQGKKVEQTVQILSDNIDRLTSSSNKQLEETHESLLRDIEGKAHDAKAELQIDVEETVPAMFRNSTGKSSFWKRLKWLFTGQA